MKNLALIDYIDEIFEISREGQYLGYDIGIARDIFTNAIREGRIPDGESEETREILGRACADIDFAVLKTKFDGMTVEQWHESIKTFNEEVKRIMKEKNKALQ